MTERERKYQAFVEDDLENNHGLIVTQYKEVCKLMEDPAEMIGFWQGYLINLLTFATRHSEFYKKYRNFQSIHDFPVVNKQILKDHWDEVYSDEFRDCKDNKIEYTSGSTGTPFQIVWDHRKHCRMIADIKWFAHMAGVESHERIAYIVVNIPKNKSSAEKQQRDNVFNIYSSYFDDSSIERILAELEEINPKLIIACASMWEAIANYIDAGKAATCKIHLTALITEAEIMKERTKVTLEKYFGCTVYSRYGSHECGTWAQEDGTDYGFRVNQSSYYMEILDINRDTPVKDGEVGRVVITDLFNYAFPLIRYDTGDLASKIELDDGKVYLNRLVGRVVDMLYTTDGKMVFWSYPLLFLSNHRDIKQIQVIQESRYHYTWKLNTDNKGYEETIQEMAKKIFGPDSIHEIVYVDEIPRLRSGKTRVTMCKIDPSKEFQ